MRSKFKNKMISAEGNSDGDMNTLNSKMYVVKYIFKGDIVFYDVWDGKKTIYREIKSSSELLIRLDLNNLKIKKYFGYKHIKNNEDNKIFLKEYFYIIEENT